MRCNSPAITYIGHATVLVEMEGACVLTDPLLRDHVAHLYRHAPSPDLQALPAPDVVLISHSHYDHLDIPSLLLLGTDRHLVVPFGAARFLRRRGFTHVDEVKPGESVVVGALRITATPARHSGFRPPAGPSAVAVGFVVTGGCRVYFAGDTDIYPEMADLAGQIDVALLPVWGWGRSLGRGHLDPERAVEALTLVQPSLAIPIHWGTFTTRAVRKRAHTFLVDPPQQFAQLAARRAPKTAIEILQPGSCMTLAAYWPASRPAHENPPA